MALSWRSSGLSSSNRELCRNTPPHSAEAFVASSMGVLVEHQEETAVQFILGKILGHRGLHS